MAPSPAGPSTDTPAPKGKGTTKVPPTTLPSKPNISEVAFGNLLVKPWYPSFYPEELVGRDVERLYVCQWCFKYTREVVPFLGHVRYCERRDGRPPGEEVYCRDGYSLFEVDGEVHKLYAQNLSLFAKLFLDTKSVFYDVTTFLYYVLVAHMPSPHINIATVMPSQGAASASQPQAAPQVVGFFSKEKMSWDNNNLACILVFPPWQKQGLGQILMGASYELGKREGRFGGPEKPLSELGHRAYVHYWSQTLARVILALPVKKTVTVHDLRDETYISTDDIFATLDTMEVLVHKERGGASVLINKAKVRQWVEQHKVDLKNPVDPDAFPKFERSSSEG